MKNSLPAMLAGVCDNAKTFFELLGSYDFFESAVHRQRSALIEFKNILHVPARNQQDVSGGNGINIPERECIRIGIHLCRRNSPGHNFAKEAIFHF
jgi:hypothetical protein